MKKEIGIIALNDHYSGKRHIRENKRLYEDGTPLKLPATYLQNPGIKSEKLWKITGYFYDLGELKPESFQIDYETFIVFDNKEISEKYTSNVYTGKNEPDVYKHPTDDQMAKDIDATIAGKQSDKVAKETKSIIDYQEFYHGYFSKKIPTYAVDKKLKDLVRSGTLDLGEFEITAVNYATVIDDKALFGQFLANHKRFMDNKKFNPKILFGYSLYLSATDRNALVNRAPKATVKKMALEVCRTLTEVFEREILDRTTYYNFMGEK